MASRYWVGGTANWDATVGTKWAATSGGAGGQTVPTAADDVFFDAASGVGVTTIPTATTVLARSVTCTGYTGTLTHASSSAVLTVGDASGGAFTLSAGMTYNPSTAALNFVSTSNNGGVGWTITTAGKTIGQPVFNGVGGKWVLGDAMTCVGGGTLFVSAGTFDTSASGFAVTVDTFSYSSVGVRTVNLNSSTVTCRGVGSFAGTTTNNLTFNAGTSTIVVTPSTSGAFTAPVVSLFNVTFTGLATKTGLVSIGADFTATGTVTIAGNSLTNRLLVISNSTGLKRTITAAVAALSNADFTDIGGAGAATWSGTSLGDATGNTGITFTTPVTRYGVVAGSWSSTATWSTTSGGAGGASVPLPQDTVRLDANSAAGNYFCDMPRLGKDLDCTGFTRTFQQNGIAMYGSMTLSSGMAVNFGGGFTFAGRGTHTLTTAGKAMTAANHNVGAGGSAGGTYTMQDAWSGASTFTIQCGFSAGGFSLTLNFGVVAGTATRTVDFGASTVSFNGNWTYSSVVGLTLLANLATFALSVASATARTFNGGGYTYGTLTYTVANSPGGLTITGANTFVTLNVGSGRTLTLPSSTTTVVTNWNVVGQNNGYVYLPGGTGNYISAPSSTALSVTGDIDIRVRTALDDWTPLAFNTLTAKWTIAGQQSYSLGVNSAGTLSFSYSPDGTTTRTANSTVNPGLTDGTIYWVRATRRQSDGRVQFFTASGALTNPADTDFTQVGVDVILNATEAMFASTAVLCVGIQSAGTNAPATGKFYRAQVRSGLTSAGTLVFDADLVNKAFGANTFVESSSQAATVTLNGTAPVGDGRIFLNSSTGGTAATISKPSGSVISGYLKIQDSTASGGATWYAGASSVSVSNNTGWQFINMPVGVSQTALWNARAPIGVSRTGLWNTRAALGLSRIALWNTRTKATKNLTGLWNVRTPVNKTSIGLWNVRAKIGLARTALWNVRSLASNTRTALWNTRSRASATRSALWNVRTPTGGTRTVLWNILASTSVGKSQTMLWGVRTATGSTRTALWTARTPIATTRTALWNIRKPVTLDRTARWNLRTPIAQTRTLLWRITQPVTLTRTAKWNTRNAVNRTTVARWNTRSNAGRTWTALWRVRYHDRDITARFGQPTSGWYTQPPTSTWTTQAPISTWTISRPARGENNDRTDDLQARYPVRQDPGVIAN